MEKNKEGVITGEFKNARYAKDKILYIPPESKGFTKNRESRLAEAKGVNGKYTNREKGYIMSKKQAENLKEHLIKGHDAEFISGKIIEKDESHLHYASSRERIISNFPSCQNIKYYN
jgi:hypothetical protein